MTADARIGEGDSTRAARRRNLLRFFAPARIAFVGGQSVIAGIELCRRGGFAGDIRVVNSRQPEVAGLPCVPTVADLPEPPDAVFVGISREQTIEVVRALAARGAGGVVCYAAGFAEVGGEGVRLQQELVAAAGDLALVGPNCLGCVNNVVGASLWPFAADVAPVERGAALISQSGALSVHLMMNQRSLRFSHVVSVGNQAVLGVEHFIDVLADDPHVAAIGIYLEGLRDIPGFSRAALKAAANGVPIVVLKSGTSRIGSSLTVSHTSSIAGSDELYRALFERLGVVRVDAPAELIETLKALAVSRPPAGRRLAVFTCSGGSSSLGADVADRVGLDLPPLSATQADGLRRALPYFATVSNPLDYNTSLWGKEEPLRDVFTTVMGEGYDAGVLLIDFTPPAFGTADSEFAVTRALIRAHRDTGVPAYAVSLLPDLLPAEARELLSASGVPPLQGLQEGFKAIAAAVAFGEHRARVCAHGALPPVSAVGPLPAGVVPRLLDEWESKQRLAHYGLPIPAGRLVGAAEAGAAAETLGFPVVVKVVSAAVPHKTEAGAVRLGLGDAAAVRASIDEMVQAVKRHAPAATADRFLVEPMVPGAVAEILIGVTRRDDFGLALAIGTGGTMVELVRDVRMLLLPVDRAAVARAIRSLSVARLLDGFRGKPKGDVEALIDAVLAVARFAEAHAERLVEVDVNPVLVLPTGQGVVAVDALLRLAE